MKYFFAQDMLNYAHMIPVYLAEMEIVKDTNPEIYQELQNGNWVVNKNAKGAFCAVGADNAPEHASRSMKVSGGLIGITLNPPARTKYFLIAPGLARLAEQARLMAGILLPRRRLAITTSPLLSGYVKKGTSSS